MPKKTIYLCGPIADRTEEESGMWRHIAEWRWRKLGTALNPLRHELPQGDPRVVALDLADIDASDGLLVMYDGKPSVGSSMEVMYAWTKGKTIVLINIKDAELSPWHTAHVHAVVNTVHDGVDYLQEALGAD